MGRLGSPGYRQEEWWGLSIIRYEKSDNGKQLEEIYLIVGRSDISVTHAVTAKRRSSHAQRANAFAAWYVEFSKSFSENER